MYNIYLVSHLVRVLSPFFTNRIHEMVFIYDYVVSLYTVTSVFLFNIRIWFLWNYENKYVFSYNYNVQWTPSCPSSYFMNWAHKLLHYFIFVISFALPDFVKIWVILRESSHLVCLCDVYSYDFKSWFKSKNFARNMNFCLLFFFKFINFSLGVSHL